MPLATRVAPGGQTTIRWSPALAGLRGLAILLVLLFHLGLPVASGGPVGVTVFFVLSGFLITTLLVVEIGASGRVDLIAFYRRRARRLLPALGVAVLGILIVAAAVGQPAAVIGDSLLALSYLSNWARADGDGVGIWNHAWSLAIEGQFYLGWPLILLAIRRLAPLTSRAAIGWLLVLAATSVGVRLVLAGIGAPADRLYFGTDTRAEALLIGSALACLHARRPDLRVPRWAAPAALVAIACLAAAPSVNLAWTGSSYTLVAVATAILVLSLVDSQRRAIGLASRPMVWLGERSYSLYLWHVPVVMALGGAGLGPGLLGSVGVPAVISLVLAALSYRYVEQPFQRGRARRSPAVPARVMTTLDLPRHALREAA